MLDVYYMFKCMFLCCMCEQSAGVCVVCTCLLVLEKNQKVTATQCENYSLFRSQITLPVVNITSR